MIALLLGLSSASAMDVLFVGNSYVLSNDLPTALSTVFESAEQSATTGRLAADGLRLPEHLARASDPTSPWYEKLVTEGDEREWVVLQDQSQIPGFPQTQVDWTRSRDAAVGLNELVTEAGAETMFFITWGRRDGDGTNPARFSSFSVMQALLTRAIWHTVRLLRPTRGLCGTRPSDRHGPRFMMTSSKLERHPRLETRSFTACTRTTARTRRCWARNSQPTSSLLQ